MTVQTRVALYLRVSTDQQAEQGFSLPAQLERLHAHAKGQGWTVAGEYVDEGHSGRTTKRPAYTRLLAEKDSWDTVLVMKMDRIHRNSRHFLAMMDWLKQHQKEFASVTESLDTGTAMGRFVMSIISSIGQLESEQIGERVMVGMSQKASQSGGGLGGPAPFGYRWESGKFVIVPVEAKRVKEIFSLHGKGISNGKIATHLNVKGVLTRRGKPWTFWSIQHILQNNVYFGDLDWNGILQKDQHEAIRAPK